MTSSRKPTAGFWITVALVVVLAYPLSLGPACWITSRTNSGAGMIPVIYRPIVSCLSSRKMWLRRAIARFSDVGAAQGWRWRPARDLPIREHIATPDRWEWRPLLIPASVAIPDIPWKHTK